MITLKESKQFCKSFYHIPETKTKERFEEAERDLRIAKKEIENYKKQLKHVEDNKTSLKRKFTAYNKKTRPFLISQVFGGDEFVIHTLDGYTANKDYIEYLLEHNKHNVKVERERIRKYKKELEAYKNKKPNPKKLDETAKRIVQTCDELKISNLRYAEENDHLGQISLTIHIVNPFESIVKENKGANYKLEYDLDIEISNWGEVYANFTKKMWEELDKIDGSAYTHIHANSTYGGFSSICVGDYNFTEYIDENNPVMLLYKLHYFLHSYNPDDDYGGAEFEEKFINRLPDSFFRKIRVKKKRALNTANARSRKKVMEWLKE